MLKEGEKIWAHVLEIIKEKVSETNFTTWFEPTVGEDIHQNSLIVRVPNSFHVEWLESHFHQLIYDTVASVYGSPLKIKYKVEEKTQKIGFPTRLYEIDSANLQPRYTFDNFVVGESNKFAHAASLAVAKNPGKLYNPLFIYGGVGLGKTHLLQAIGNYIKKNSDLKVYYTGCESFMNEMIDGIQNNRMIQFKNKYRKKDALLIDDIEFLEGKEGLQEEIYHVFNALYGEGRQIVFTSDRPPSALKRLEERLVSRFQGGLVCDIKPPTFEMRIAILKNKASSAGVNISDDIIAFIAENIQTNIREIEGALIKLLAFSSINKKELTLNEAKKILKDTIPEKKEITIEKIQKAIASYYNISLSTLRSKRRLQSIVLPRDIAIYLARELTPLALKDIGDSFGKDHATIIYSHKKIKEKIETNSEFKEEINNIIKLIKGE